MQGSVSIRALESLYDALWQVREKRPRPAWLSGGGFDPTNDIQAITVNRWPHGYAYEYNPLFEPLDRPGSERPCVIGRQPFGRITIANSDSDGHAYTNIAINQAYRAVNELFATAAHHRQASTEAQRAG